MTCVASREGLLPSHAGVPCWTWTCGKGPACGHGHYDDHHRGHHDSYGHALQHAVDDELMDRATADGALAHLEVDTSHWLKLGLTGKVPLISMEHHAPKDCPRCKTLRDAGLNDQADAAKGGR